MKSSQLSINRQTFVSRGTNRFVRLPLATLHSSIGIVTVKTFCAIFMTILNMVPCAKNEGEKYFQ